MISVGQFDVTAERLRRARELFETILTREKSVGANWLAQECGGDIELRTMVERMIEADDRVCPILDQRLEPTPDLHSRDSGALKPGDRVGAYRVVREIGIGGMGAVYQAELADPEPDVLVSSVAIKVVRWYSREVWRRFEQEQSILRGLRHPKVARLLDSGVTESRSPYLVMEFVEGIPIHFYCEENGLSIEDRIRLFRQVCEAVSYLHRNLVIHRDLKPGNVLVTADGGVKLVDFGIAKLLQASEMSPSPPIQIMVGMMTPDYASPEQIRGSATSTLTDVYSLGILLYELLTGERPFSAPLDHAHETLRRICEEEPRKPSLLAARCRPDRGGKQLRGELDNIVLKAIRKEPERRYGSADQLGEDLQNYLKGQPVFAQGDSVAYRARKFANRHKRAVAGGIAAIAVLTVGVVSTLSEARVARHEWARAEAQAHEANHAKEVAEEQRSEANAQRASAMALRALAEQRALDADRERAKANRRLEKLEELAKGAVRIYDANKEADKKASSVIAQNVRDSLLTLQRERRLQPGLADALDRSSATRQSYELAGDPSWEITPGWLATETKPGEYRIGKDHLIVHSGKSSLFLRSLATQPVGAATVSQIFRGEPFRGRRVKLSAFLRTEAVAGRVYLGLVASGQTSRVAVWGTTSWKQYSVVTDVPLEADELRLMMTLQGAGTLWADDLGFEQVSTSIPLSTKQPENLNFTAIQQLK